MSDGYTKSVCQTPPVLAHSGLAVGAGAGRRRVELPVYELPSLLAAALGAREAGLEHHGRDAGDSDDVPDHRHKLSWKTKSGDGNQNTHPRTHTTAYANRR